jgi:AcrR family transcriptional regulator
MPAAAPAVDAEVLLRIRERLPARSWEAITMAELADASGLSRMTLYRRGITKDELLVQFSARMAGEYRDALFGPLTAPGPAGERLRAALEAICDVNERYLRLLDALAGSLEPVYHEDGEPGQPVLTRAVFTDALRRLLEDGARDGSVAAEPSAETATLLLNAVDHTYRHMRVGHRWPADVARRRVVALAVDGVLR